MMRFQYQDSFYRMERTELEPINSYYRLLVHRVARYYGVEHTIEPARPAILILSKTLESKMYALHAVPRDFI